MPTLSIHVNDDTFKEISALADQLDRSRSWIVGEALEPYLEHRRWMNEITREALEGLRNGTVKTIPHDEAVARIMAYTETCQ
jgi:predicted transcriptional regulator